MEEEKHENMSLSFGHLKHQLVRLMMPRDGSIFSDQEEEGMRIELFRLLTYDRGFNSRKDIRRFLDLTGSRCWTEMEASNLLDRLLKAVDSQKLATFISNEKKRLERGRP